MSFSAPGSKVPSPARSPRESLSAERPSHAVNKPTGIINMGMTCFLNSTFQALTATPALISLLRSNPALPLQLALASQLPLPVQSPSKTPCLRPESLEPQLYPLLPVTRAFTNSLHKAWTMKDAGGGTAGPGETSSRYSLSLRQLLREMAAKYDQYDEFAQQDAHELLRHLLDSMQMEEKDVIKRLPGAAAANQAASQPPESSSSSQTSLPRTLPQAGSEGTPNGITPPVRVGSLSAGSTSSASLGRTPQAHTSPGPPISPLDPSMVPFVDALFGGLLASVVVCETCKSVSHTYEGFLDISLSMRGDDDAPKARKRDRIRSIASRLTPKSHHKHKLEPSAVMSEPEGSDSERKARHHGLGHGQPSQPAPGSDDSDNANLTRSVSSARSLTGKVRPSFSFRRKGGRKTSSTASSPTVEPTTSASAPLSPNMPMLSPKLSATIPGASPELHHAHAHQATPTPAQAAYIQRILYGPPGPPETIDPLAKLRAAHAGGLGSVPTPSADSGLIDSLKAFMSVEVLEGDNAFACHKCWKIKNGHYKRPDGEKSPVTSHSLTLPPPVNAQPNGLHDVPAIAVDSADDGELEDRDNSRTGRYTPRTNRGLVRAPSPLRQMVERHPSVSFPANLDAAIELSHVDTELSTISADSAVSLATNASAATATSATTLSSGSTSTAARADSESDGLSDSTDDEELPEPNALPQRRSHFFRPGLTRAQSRNKHFILRRAFKRYLVAKAPEVLVFHLKRFKQVSGSVYTSFSSLKKMDEFVSFPAIFDLAPFMAPLRTDFKVVNSPGGPRAPYQDWPSPEQPPETAPVLYQLYAVVVHMGTMVGGHYIAYVLIDPERLFASTDDASAERLAQLALEDRPRRGGKDRRVWCYCSDTTIRLASLDEVMSARAYLCFYEKLA